jgi:phytoene/squalene synthetase
MLTALASSITKAASKQTYYTIRFLADRQRVDDAYRAYGYFRWVDDVLDGNSGSGSERKAFIERQEALLEACYRGEMPRDVDFQENMLVELVRHDHEKHSGLQSYLRNMMLVMDFDARRRGRRISQFELNEYTRWLAVAVTDAIHYFIGNTDESPHDDRRYRAVSAAHVAHMLRDTFEDVQAGYYNIPCEVLEANHIGPQDVQSPAYRAWVEGRVLLARADFMAGKEYFRRVRSRRCRLASFAYMARFEWFLDTLSREDYSLRPHYPERKSPGTGLRMSWQALTSMINLPGEGALSQPIPSRPLGKL